MLLPADEALVLRDDGVPALGLLLDEERLGTWLGDQHGAPTRWSTRYLRYKQGTSCVIAGDLETAEGTRPCFASGHASDALEKLTKTLQRAPAGSVLGTDPSCVLVVASPSADRDLPGLARIDDERGSRRLLHGLLGDRAGLRGAELRTLRYKPQRRWVGILQPRRGSAVVLRAYRPGAAGRAVEAIRACAAGAGTPSLIGADPSRGVAAVEYIQGRVLSQSGPDETGDLTAIRGVGTVLGRLHSAHDVALHSRGNADAQAVLSAADQLVALLPDQAEEVHGLSAKVAGRLLNTEPVRRPIHGDFSLDQVVIDQSGAATLIDLDEAHLGDPAADLACAAAALARDEVLGRVSAGLATSWIGALYEGYAEVLDPPSEARLAVHQAAHLLRRAVEPFRLRQTADWPAAALELVARAGQIVTSESFMEGGR
jgi:aminoglycoside phosphotransferase (APT) family kinase protein